MKGITKLFGSVPAPPLAQEPLAAPLVQPPSTDRQEKMDTLSSLLPIIPGQDPKEVAISVKNAIEKNRVFNTTQQVDNAVAPGQSNGKPENESADQAPAVQSPGESSSLAPSNSADPTVLNEQTESSVEKLFPQEHPMKETYAALELESKGDRDSFFEIIRKKTASLSTPTDKASLDKFLELVLCLYIRLEGKVPPVTLDNCKLENFTKEVFEEGEVKDYPALLLRVLEKFQK